MYSPYGAAMMDHHHHHHQPFAMGGPMVPPFMHPMMGTPPLQGNQSHRGFGPQHMLHQHHHHLHHHHHHHLSLQQQQQQQQYATPAAFPTAAFSTPIARQRTPTGNTLTPGRTVATAWMPASGNSASAIPTSASGTKPTGSSIVMGAGTSAPALGEQGTQHSLTSAAHNGSSIERVNPLSGKTLERDLSNASKEELIQVLLDLSSCNYDASGFIHTKAQLFSLRSTVTTTTKSLGGPCGKEEMPLRPVVGHHTPSKSLFASQLTDGATPDPSGGGAVTLPQRSAAGPNSTGGKDVTIASQPRRSMVASGSPATSAHSGAAVTGSPCSTASPIRDLQQSLHDRHITPETRPFSTELHPCTRLFGACRHSTNCVFRTMPNNLCLHWVRGCCSSGNECNYVHRLPNPCPSTVQTVFDLAHGQDRNHAAQLRAAQEQQHHHAQQHVALQPPPALTTPAKQTTSASAAELSSLSGYEGGLSTPTCDDQRTSRQLIMSESEDVPEGVDARLIDDEHHDGERRHDSCDVYHHSAVARTLDDSFERAAS